MSTRGEAFVSHARLVKQRRVSDRQPDRLEDVGDGHPNVDLLTTRNVFVHSRGDDSTWEAAYVSRPGHR